MSDTREMQAELEQQRRKVDVDNYTITVRELLSMAENNELHRAPEYQRKFRWDEEAESRLIESILLGLPVPSLFFATNDDGTWEIVDGLQRVSTLIHFASDSAGQLNEIAKEAPLKLSGLKKLESFNGLGYKDLPPAVQMTFTKRGLNVTALSDKSDVNSRFDTFERLNSGAVQLSAQEVRACIYAGPFNDLLRELAEDERFMRLVKLQAKAQEDGTREELVLKFFAYLNDRERFRGAVKEFLNQYMQENRDGAELEEFRAEFASVVTILDGLLGGQPFLRTKVNITPQNQLDAVMVALAEVIRDHGKTCDVVPENWLDDEELVSSSTGATNTRTMLTRRISRAKQLLAPTD